MKQFLIFTICALCGLSVHAASYKMHYTVTPDTTSHYLNIRLDYQGQGQGGHELVLNMPRWAPGYYELLDFAKHLCDFRATDSKGHALTWRKDGMNRWRIQLPTEGRAEVTYRVYANQRDVASSRAERDIAFVAPPGVFMHVDGDLRHPVTVTFRLPKGWQHISTGLKPLADDATTFTAPDFDTLYDSPFLLGNYYKSRFTHEGHDYEFALETPDGAEEIGLEYDFRRIVSAATRLMGDVPYDNYCLIHMGEGGGGLEHLNSQACYTDGTYRFPSRRAHVKFLAFVAHEYFHLYNVKCIRPVELWPIDYDREAITPMLWVSEGLTCYYEYRLLQEAGITTDEEGLELLSTYLQLYAPYEGQHHMSLRQSSYDIWLNFMNPDDNYRDTRISYYFKGPIIGLLLDIAIREKTAQRQSLDDVMRLLYRRYYQQLHRGFTEEEFWQTVTEVAGRPLTEIRTLVDTTAPIDYDRLLAPAGLRVDTTDWTIRRIKKEKKIYIPEDLRGMDLQADTSQWSFKRSVETDDLIFMWERGFGQDTYNPPMLDGKPMSFNLNNLRDRVQSFYTFFRDTLGFVKTKNEELRVKSYDYLTDTELVPDNTNLQGNHNSSLFALNSQPSKADLYKMMVMVMYSLDGTAYGGTYDNFIGGLWVAPNRIQDTKMNCMAHELGHSFQTQIMADSIGEAWGGSGFFEMTSQWMLWQVNPDWLTDENYHFEAFKQLTHKAYLHLENIYHSPYVIQWWSDLHGRKSIAELYRQGKIGEDPVMTYKRMYGLTQQQFNEEMLRGYQHLVNFDFKHARKETRQYACTFNTELNHGDGSYRVGGGYRPKYFPEEYGFNAILLDSLVDIQKPVNIEVRGMSNLHALTGITTNDEEIYSDINAGHFEVPAGKTLEHLYLIVMGAPEEHYMIPMPSEENPEPKVELEDFPYEFWVKNP